MCTVLNAVSNSAPRSNKLSYLQIYKNCWDTVTLCNSILFKTLFIAEPLFKILLGSNYLQNLCLMIAIHGKIRLIFTQIEIRGGIKRPENTTARSCSSALERSTTQLRDTVIATCCFSSSRWLFISRLAYSLSKQWSCWAVVSFFLPLVAFY